MSKEIEFVDPLGTGFTNYVNLKDSVGQWYNTVAVAFQAFNGANWTDYDLAATEVGTSGEYTADMPAVAAGVYNLVARNRSGGSPAQTDRRVASGTLYWTGTVVVSVTGNDFADALLARNIAGGSSSGRLVKEAFYHLRNKVAIVGTTKTVYAVDDTTPSWTSTLTTDAAAIPITSDDPA